MPAKITGQCQNRGCTSPTFWNRPVCEPCSDRARRNEEDRQVADVAAAKDELLILLGKIVSSLPGGMISGVDSLEINRLLRRVEEGR